MLVVDGFEKMSGGRGVGTGWSGVLVVLSAGSRRFEKCQEEGGLVRVSAGSAECW